MNKNNTKIMALLLAAVLAVSGCAGADSAPAEENGTQEPAEQGAREAAAAAGNTVKDEESAEPGSTKTEPAAASSGKTGTEPAAASTAYVPGGLRQAGRTRGFHGSRYEL